MKISIFLSTLVIGGFSAGAVADNAGSEPGREWRFKVYLNDREIGYHSFRLADQGDEQHLTSEARFKVKILFFNAYRYEHVNSERWEGNCLERIEAATDVNGDAYSVLGSQVGDRFEVSTAQGNDTLKGCVKTFAYWNPEFLESSRLLNSQTGEYIDVDVAIVSEAETLNVKGQSVEATRYRLVAEGLEIDLWYSTNQEWLALESKLEKGRKLRYELI